MYKIILTIFLFCGINHIQAEIIVEKYYVVHTQGVILLKEKETPLKRGMLLNSTDKLILKSKNAKAILIGSQRGRYILQKNQNKQAIEPGIFTLVSDLILPMKKNTHLGSRGTQTIVSDFEQYFGKDILYVIGNQLEIKPDSRMFPNNGKFFTAIYRDTTISSIKIISYKDEVLTFDREKLIKNKEIAYGEITTFQIRWGRAKVTQATLVFINKEELMAQYKSLQEFTKNEELNEANYQEYFYGYFRDVYGYTDQNLLNEFIKELNE